MALLLHPGMGFSYFSHFRRRLRQRDQGPGFPVDFPFCLLLSCDSFAVFCGSNPMPLT